jgi:hypothetical protein
MLKAIEARNAISLDSVLKQLNSLRGGGGTGVQPASSVASSPVAAPATRQIPKNHVVHKEAVAVPVPLAEATPVPADLAGLWTKLVEAVGRVSPFTRSYLVDANPVSFDKNLLTIGFDPEFEDHLGLVDNARNHTLLQTKLAELGHANAQIKFVKTEASAARMPQPAKVTSPTLAAPKQSEGRAPASSTPAAKEKPVSVAFNKNDFKNDPLIQKALEIFKGQIVEVRA